MNQSRYLLASYSDPTWIDRSIAKMGEKKFWTFKNKVYDLLDNLKVGESLKIDPMWSESNIDFYVKMSCYYISEANGCYSFNRDYNEVRRQFDNEKITASLELLKKNKINAN